MMERNLSRRSNLPIKKIKVSGELTIEPVIVDKQDLDDLKTETQAFKKEWKHSIGYLGISFSILLTIVGGVAYDWMNIPLYCCFAFTLGIALQKHINARRHSKSTESIIKRMDNDEPLNTS